MTRGALVIVWLAAGCDTVFGFDVRDPDAGPLADAALVDAEGLDAEGLDAATDAPGLVAITQVVAGGAHTCAVASERVKCWGLSSSGQLGYAAINDIGDDEVPRTSPDVEVGPGTTALALGGAHTCALITTGAVRCWGQGQGGRLGYANQDSIGDNEAPSTAGDVSLAAVSLAAVARQVVAGDAHTCARLASGGVKCWGVGTSGRLGYGNINTIGDNEVPAAVGDVALGEAALALAAGDAHTCAVLSSGAVRCWGQGLDGRLGYGHLSDVGDGETPVQEAAIAFPSPVVELAAGTAHTCARLMDGTVRCWGANAFGQLGYASTATIGDNEAASSAAAVSLGASAVAITAGGEHTCALLADQTVRCWGRGASGQLGHGNTNNIGAVQTPAAVAVVPVGGAVAQIAAGRAHTCARLATGAVRCWGLGFNGRLGYGTTLTIGDDEVASSAGDVPAF